MSNEFRLEVNHYLSLPASPAFTGNPHQLKFERSAHTHPYYPWSSQPLTKNPCKNPCRYKVHDLRSYIHDVMHVILNDGAQIGATLTTFAILVFSKSPEFGPSSMPQG